MLKKYRIVESLIKQHRKTARRRIFLDKNINSKFLKAEKQIFTKQYQQFLNYKVIRLDNKNIIIPIIEQKSRQTAKTGPSLLSDKNTFLRHFNNSIVQSILLSEVCSYNEKLICNQKSKTKHISYILSNPRPLH